MDNGLGSKRIQIDHDTIYVLTGFDYNLHI